MRILIIEDDKDLAQLTKLALEKENFTVDMCLDGAEGLYYMRENMYDLVLLDRMLPSMDGTQVLKEARQSRIMVREFRMRIRRLYSEDFTGLIRPERRNSILDLDFALPGKL